MARETEKVRRPRIAAENFVGKTIRELDTSSHARVGFVFTDGRKVELEIVPIMPRANLFGIAEVPTGYDPLDDDSSSGYRRPSRDPQEVIDYLRAIADCEDGGDFMRAEVKELLEAPDTFFARAP